MLGWGVSGTQDTSGSGPQVPQDCRLWASKDHVFLGGLLLHLPKCMENSQMSSCSESPLFTHSRPTEQLSTRRAAACLPTRVLLPRGLPTCSQGTQQPTGSQGHRHGDTPAEPEGRCTRDKKEGTWKV